MTDNDQMALPLPTLRRGNEGDHHDAGRRARRTREYAEVFVPGDEPLEDGELRVTVLGSGNPWTTRAQASASILVEVGNPERDLLRLRPRGRLARELREPEAAGQPARQGVPDPPARRPHGRHDHALRQLREGRTRRRPGQGLGSERHRASSRHEVLLRRDRDGARVGHRGRQGPDQRRQHEDRGTRVRLEPDRRSFTRRTASSDLRSRSSTH